MPYIRSIPRVVMVIAIVGLAVTLWWWGLLPHVSSGSRLPLIITVAGVLCAAVLAGVVSAWWLETLDAGQLTTLEARARVATARANFKTEVLQARVAARATPEDVPPMPLVQEVLNEFDLLDKQLDAFDDNTSSELLEAIADQAAELERSKVYFIAPRAALLHTGKAALEDMREWGVPQASLERMTTEVVPLLASPLTADARAALSALVRLRDQWDPYATWYNGFMGRTAATLLVMLLMAIAAAGAFFREGHLLTSFALAGIGGATLSVLSRLPPLAAYGEATQYVFRIVSRIGTGFAASLIGTGLLATGVITVTLPGVGSFGGVVTECSVHPPSAPRMISAQQAPANVTTTGGTVQQTSSGGADATADLVPSCGTNQILALLAIAMILGFSERALATFEDRVFPRGTLVPVPVTRNGGDGDGKGNIPPVDPTLVHAEEAARNSVAAAERAQSAAAKTAAAAEHTLAVTSSGTGATEEPGRAQEVQQANTDVTSAAAATVAAANTAEAAAKMAKDAADDTRESIAEVKPDGESDQAKSKTSDVANS